MHKVNIHTCSATYEDAYIYTKDIGVGNEDKEKGFDRPSMTAGYQLGMMRLGMPDKLLRLDLKVSRRGRIIIRHAYGYAAPFQKGDAGSCGFGCTQGSEDGPDKYDAFEDAFNSHWQEMNMGIQVSVSEYETMLLKGGGYV